MGLRRREFDAGVLPARQVGVLTADGFNRLAAQRAASLTDHLPRLLKRICPAVRLIYAQEPSKDENAIATQNETIALRNAGCLQVNKLRRDSLKKHAAETLQTIVIRNRSKQDVAKKFSSGIIQMNRDTDIPNTKVSEYFDLRDAPYLQSVLDAINAAHTVRNLPRIRVLRLTLRPGVGGYYDDRNNPPVIAIARQTLNADLSFLHEIGHFIDHQGINEAGEYASIHSPLLENWRNAVHQSASVAALQRLRVNALPAAQQHIDYLLSDKELFARCYAQYIAFKSRHLGLMACLRDDFLNHAAPIQSSKQWQENDFAPIANALEDVFKQRRWIP